MCGAVNMIKRQVNLMGWVPVLTERFLCTAASGIYRTNRDHENDTRITGKHIPTTFVETLCNIGNTSHTKLHET